MLRRIKLFINFSLIVAIVVLYPLLLTYEHYDALVEADFLAAGKKFEAGDLGDFLTYKQKILGLCSSLALMNSQPLLAIDVQLNFPALVFPSPNSDPSVLRC
jgi:hypothetical protein